MAIMSASSTTRTTPLRNTPQFSTSSAASSATFVRFYWQTDTSISNKSWGYIKDDTFKSPEFVVHQLIDIVSKNGNLLLNIGPRSDGTIPEEVQKVLRDVGCVAQRERRGDLRNAPVENLRRRANQGRGWLVSRYRHCHYTPEDFRFTTKGNALYAIELGWPSIGEAVLHSLGSGAVNGQKIGSVVLLGSDTKLAFKQQADALRIHLPPQSPGKYAYAFRIMFEGMTP